MRFVDLISLIVDNLSRRKGRVLLTAIGVVIGTAAVVTLVSLGAGLQQNATNQLWGINDLSSIQVYPGYPTQQGMASPIAIKEEDIKKLDAEAIASFRAIPGVTDVIIRDYLAGGTEISYEKLMGWSSIMGVSVDDLADLNLKASQGITQPGKTQVVVGAWVSRNFYNPNQRPNDPPIEPPDLMGKTLKVSVIRWSEDGTQTRKNLNLEVVGVLAESQSESDYSIYLPLSEVNRLNDWVAGKRVDRDKEGYNQLVVKAESPKVVVEIAKQITNTEQAEIRNVKVTFSLGDYTSEAAPCATRP